MLKDVKIGKGHMQTDGKKTVKKQKKNKRREKTRGQYVKNRKYDTQLHGEMTEKTKWI